MAATVAFDSREAHHRSVRIDFASRCFFPDTQKKGVSVSLAPFRPERPYPQAFTFLVGNRLGLRLCFGRGLLLRRFLRQMVTDDAAADSPNDWNAQP